MISCQKDYIMCLLCNHVDLFIISTNKKRDFLEECLEFLRISVWDSPKHRKSVFSLHLFAFCLQQGNLFCIEASWVDLRTIMAIYNWILYIYLNILEHCFQQYEKDYERIQSGNFFYKLHQLTVAFSRHLIKCSCCLSSTDFSLSFAESCWSSRPAPCNQHSTSCKWFPCIQSMVITFVNIVKITSDCNLRKLHFTTQCLDSTV